MYSNHQGSQNQSFSPSKGSFFDFIQTSSAFMQPNRSLFALFISLVSRQNWKGHKVSREPWTGFSLGVGRISAVFISTVFQYMVANGCDTAGNDDVLRTVLQLPEPWRKVAEVFMVQCCLSWQPVLWEALEELGGQLLSMVHIAQP